MDDILVHTHSSLEDHRTKVHCVLNRLEKHNLFLKPEKCQFERTRVEFLGVVLEQGMVQMDPSKVEVVRRKPTPMNLRKVQEFLGFTGYYHYFVPNYSKIARPLIELTKKAVPFEWGEAQEKAFQTL